MFLWSIKVVQCYVYVFFNFLYWKIYKILENTQENTGINCSDLDGHPEGKEFWRPRKLFSFRSPL